MRQSEHLRYARLNKDDPTGVDYNRPEHDMRHHRISTMQPEPPAQTLRNIRKQYWIFQLNTLKPVSLIYFDLTGDYFITS